MNLHFRATAMDWCRHSVGSARQHSRSGVLNAQWAQVADMNGHHEMAERKRQEAVKQFRMARSFMNHARRWHEDANGTYETAEEVDG